jgi:hypothetical protein
LEEVLVERLAVTLWRLRRLVRHERELIDVQQREVAERFAAREAGSTPWSSLLEGPSSGHIDAVTLQRLRLAADLLERLPNLASDVPLTRDEVLALLIDLEFRFDVDLASLPGAGLPPDAAWEDFPSWTVGLLYEVLAALARWEQERLETMLDQERDALATSIAQAEQRNAQAELEVARRELSEQRMRAASLLLQDDALNKLVRYEAHLHRQCFQTLHELEALQTRRRGGQAPLARLDVNGLPEAAS